MNGQWIGKTLAEHLEVLSLVDVEHAAGGVSIHWSLNLTDRLSSKFYGYEATNLIVGLEAECEYKTTPKIIDFQRRCTVSQNEQDETLAHVPRIGDVSIKLRFDGSSLNAVWQPDVGLPIFLSMPKSQADEKSSYLANVEVSSWSSFRSHVLQLPFRKFVFRGQSRPHRLRTAFHRTKKKNLWQYQNVSIPEAHQAIIGKTRHLFRLDSSDERGALLHLLQHHGYPTPLLDWSYSPYVAAYFAFSEAVGLDASANVRIFQFDREAWRADFPQFPYAAWHSPHLSFVDVLAIENTRAAPQQALSGITNVDDIETYIAEAEKLGKKKYLEVFDLNVSERNEVMRDLAMAGVTPGSLFPGIEGVCAELKARHFDYGVP